MQISLSVAVYRQPFLLIQVHGFAIRFKPSTIEPHAPRCSRYIRYMDFAHLDAEELDRLIDDARRERRRRAGTSLRCEHCGVAFAARAGAKYCSGTCRVNAHRERKTAMWNEQGGMIGIGYEGIVPEQLVDS